MNTQATDDTNTSTPYIAVAANFYGTGNSAQAARKGLVKAGGSSHEPQTVFKLPDGATGAFVADDGTIHWYGADDQVARPVFRYVDGKAVAWKPGEDKPQAWYPVTDKTKRRQPTNAQTLGEVHPEPELGDDKESTIAEMDLSSGKPKRVRRKPSAELATFGIGSMVQWTSGPMAKRVTKVGEIIHIVPAGQQPPDGMVRDPGDGRSTDSFVVKSGGRNYWPHVNSLTKAETAQSTMTVTSETVGAPIEEPFIDELAARREAQEPAQTTQTTEAEMDAEEATLAAMRSERAAKNEILDIRELPPVDTTPMPLELPRPSKPKAKGKAKSARVVDDATPTADKPKAEHADFLLFVGSAFYSKDAFIKEAGTLGISRRMPSHRLPKGLISGKSRVFVAAEGVRKTDGSPVSEVFGYFVPERVEFIDDPENGKQYTDIKAQLSLRPDTRIIDSIKGEPERECGHRIVGGTYIVVDKGDSPLEMLANPAKYEGNHFRGMLRLTADQVEAFDNGGTVNTLVNEVCMSCGAPMQCAPDGHQRAERERARIAKGDAPKWLLLDAKCQAEVRAARRAAAEAGEAGVVVTDDADGQDEESAEE